MPFQITRIALAVGLSAVCRVAARGDDVMTIAEDGRSRVAIVVAPEASEPERLAAAELAAFLGQVTGAEFAVVGSAPPDRGRILVGPVAAKIADPAFSTGGLGPEGLVIRTVGHDLILAG